MSNYTSTDWRVLKMALEDRYPGVRVETCERRYFEGGEEGLTCQFRAPVETLVHHGLARDAGVARSDARRRELVYDQGFEVGGGGSVYTGQDVAYVVHHSYDGDPPMPGTRTFPPKWVQKEVDRIWRRIVRSRRVQP